jgi:hypothetical protein
MTMSRTKRFFCLLVALIAGAGAFVTSRPASAGTTTCSPNIVEYQVPTLLIQCAPNNFIAPADPPSGCSNFTQTVDTQKIWESLAQAALLNGKSLNIYWTPCGGWNMITAVDLVK